MIFGIFLGGFVSGVFLSRKFLEFIAEEKFTLDSAHRERVILFTVFLYTLLDRESVARSRSKIVFSP